MCNYVPTPGCPDACARKAEKRMCQEKHMSIQKQSSGMARRGCHTLWPPFDRGKAHPPKPYGKCGETTRRASLVPVWGANLTRP